MTDLTLSQRLRVWAAMGGPVTITLSAQQARDIATVLEGVPDYQSALAEMRARHDRAITSEHWITTRCLALTLAAILGIAL